MIQEGEIVLINGTSCSGKTSLAREIQRISSRPWVATGHDDFLPMFPGRWVGIDRRVQPEITEWSPPGNPLSSLGFEVTVTEPDTDPPRFHLDCGPAGWNFLAGMHRAFATMARAGSSLLVADVISEVLLYDYCAALKDVRRVYLVGIHCPIEELERREASHANRTVGGARMQLETVHEPGEYDLTVNSATHGTTECARLVLDHINHNPPRVFESLVARYGAFEATRFPLRIW